MPFVWIREVIGIFIAYFHEAYVCAIFWLIIYRYLLTKLSVESNPNKNEELQIIDLGTHFQLSLIF